MDYGLHAPHHELAGAAHLMIEPTEKEDRAEPRSVLRCFDCHSRRDSRNRIREADRDVNLLKMAPHTQSMLVTESWDRPHARERAVYPLAYLRESKFWPPVARVDNPWVTATPSVLVPVSKRWQTSSNRPRPKPPLQAVDHPGR